jgi:hypothetical protein
MYNKFDNKSITEIKAICLSMLDIANKKKGKWTHRTIEKYTGLMNWLEKHQSLSPAQCQIIVDGCKLNALVCPDAVLLQAGYAVEKTAPKDVLFEHEASVPVQRKVKAPVPAPAPSPLFYLDKEQLDMIMTTVALSLSDKVYELLTQR